VCAGRAAAQPDADVERALSAANASATTGDVVAQFSLGSIYYYGTDDTAAGIAWFRKAADRKYAPAEFQLGQLYDFGFGVERNDGLALEWYRRAAGHGNPAAQRAVGEFYRKGRGVNADAAEAARWFRRAADGDDIRAQYQLGQMYFDGTALPRDYPEAYLWFSLAAAQAPLADNRDGLLELRNIAAARMTPEQLAAARKRVAAWQPRIRQVGR
jgi:TPR repeat protein